MFGTLAWVIVVAHPVRLFVCLSGFDWDYWQLTVDLEQVAQKNYKEKDG